MKHRRLFCRAIALLCGFGFTVSGFAAIPLGVLQTFTTQPTNTSWSVRTVEGFSFDITGPMLLDEVVQTNDAASISNSLPVSSSPVPAPSSRGAFWSSSSGNIQTAVSDRAYVALMATVENTSGANLSSLDVRYWFSMPAPFIGETPGLAGHRVYYSLSGLPNSWIQIPNLTTETAPLTDGAMCATLALESWHAGSFLYILWADDNGPVTDGSFAIDDFIATPAIADLCQPFKAVLQPQSVTNLQGQTVQLKVNAMGVNLTYQWYNVLRGPIPLLDNATANRATLVITSARISDTGDYFAVVSSPAGSVTSRVAHVEILHDDIPPHILSARLVVDNSTGVPAPAFQLTFDEGLCTNPLACGGDATEPFNWWVEDLVEPNREPVWLWPGDLIGGTNLMFRAELGGRSPREYRLSYLGAGITALNGYPLASDITLIIPATTLDLCSLTILEQPPAQVLILEGGSFTLTAGVSSTAPVQSQWTRNGVDIPGANALSYSIANAGCEQGNLNGTYRLRLTCPGGNSITSNPSLVLISQDVVRPILTDAIGDLAGTNITLRFSKPMSTNSAVNVASYILDPELSVLHAALSADGYAVTLTTAPRGLEEYTLRVQDVTDSRGCSGGNLLQPNPILIALTGVQEILPWASVWQYATNSQDATLGGTPWFSPSFTPGADWRSGVALFGHEISAATVAQFPAPIATFIPPNTNTPPDFITTYYRREFELPPIPSNASYVLSHFIDDGAVFYLDGVEIGRFNLRSGSPVLSTLNAIAAGEASFQHLAFAATPGPHLLAVEVHQAGPTANSDILFGAQIIAITPPPTLTILNPPRPLLLWYTDSAWELTTSTNIAGPYFTAPAYSVPRVFSAMPTNDARFYQLRFRGGFY